MKSINYKGVYYSPPTDDFKYRKTKKFWTMKCNHKGHAYCSVHETEKGAALAYDKLMIQLGKEPINVLKKMR
jgi:hypothetical protein